MNLTLVPPPMPAMDGCRFHGNLMRLPLPVMVRHAEYIVLKFGR